MKKYKQKFFRQAYYLDVSKTIYLMPSKITYHYCITTIITNFVLVVLFDLIYYYYVTIKIDNIADFP